MSQHSSNQVSYVTILPEKENQRLDNYLATLLKGVPKSRIYRLIRKGEVRVNKKRELPDYRVKANDSIRIPPIRRSDPGEARQVSKALSSLLKSRIIFENDDLLILNKPSGISVHGGSDSEIGIIEALRQVFPTLAHLELVHRLDKETSGCLVFSKKISVLRDLHQLITEDKVEKSYLLLVRGHWPKQRQKVSLPLKKNILDSGERMVRVADDGKAAVTKFKVIHYYSHSTLLESTLVTGRTHQIRVHTAHMGHPIAGDRKYGDKEFNRLMSKLGAKRLFLHAKKIRFSLANSGKIIDVSADLDDVLQQILNALRSTC